MKNDTAHSRVRRTIEDEEEEEKEKDHLQWPSHFQRRKRRNKVFNHGFSRICTDGNRYGAEGQNHGRAES
jgi:hypothetical protein